MRRDILCPVPWSQHHVQGNGEVSVCCNAVDGTVLKDDGRAFHILERPNVSEVVNSRFMRKIKAQMMAGEWPDICRHCEVAERTGGSFRHEKLRLCNRDEFERLVAETQVDGTSTPVVSSVHYIMGNKCNIKCRMCGPWSSSRWIGEAPIILGDQVPIETFRSKNFEWYTHAEAWQPLVDNVSQVRVLHLTGGEPLLISEHLRLLQRIVDAGESDHILLFYNTNLTRIPDEVRATWPRFKGVELSCSIDGFGRTNEYIRHPSKWTDVSGNLRMLDDHFDEYGITSLRIGCTVQLYNVLLLNDLVQYMLESRFKHVTELLLAPLHLPSYFDIRILPWEIRRLAAERLRESERAYAEAAAKEGVNFTVNIDEILRVLDGPEGDSADAKLREFRRVTRALDASRGENVMDLVPELAPLMDDDRPSASLSVMQPVKRHPDAPAADDTNLPSYVNLTSADHQQVEGMWNRERTFRWTGQNSSVRLKRNGHTRLRLVIVVPKLSGFVGVKAPKLRVSCGDCELGTFDLAEGKLDRAINLPSTPTLPDGPVSVKLALDSYWRPPAPDERRLGVQLLEVGFVDGPEAPASKGWLAWLR